MNISRLVIILFNIVPIIGVYFYDWRPFDMFWLFWMETLVLACFNAIRILYSQGYAADQPQEAIRLQYHAGRAIKYLFGRFLIFLFYSIFIIVFIGVMASPKGDRIGVMQTIFFGNQLFNWALLLSIASQGFYLVRYFFMNGQYYYSSPNNYAIIFDGRQIVMHVAVVLGAVGSTFLFKETGYNSYANVWIIAMLCIAKCFFELLSSNSTNTETKNIL